MHTIRLSVYMFGEEHYLYIKTERTLEEIEADWELREQLCAEAILKEMYVQRSIEEI